MRKRTVAAGIFACLIGIPGTAMACGGFFCNFQTPVDQVGEQILFAVEGNQVTAHIKIAYQGEADDFSWVLPLPGEPTLDVGTDQVFTALRALTDPKFLIEWEKNEACTYTNGCECWADAATGAGGGDPSEEGEVNVLAEGDIGPFTFKVVESTDGGALFKWLNDNGYDQPEGSQELIGHYVNQEFKFVALKLQEDKGVGDLQPIIVKYSAPNLACIPLKLTSIAAAENMPVFSWVLAKARAVPMNFFHVVLNPKAYDWLNCARPSDSDEFAWCGFGGGKDCQKEYLDLVTKAANVAAGHAFVTEYAGPASIMKDKVYVEGVYDLAKLKTLDKPGAFLSEMLGQGFPRGPFLQEIIKDNIPKPDDEKLPPECQGDQSFYGLGNVDQCSTHIPAPWTFDPAAMTNDLDERFVQPLKDAEALFQKHTYLTRLFTTISPDEMTKDPIFSFNPDLPDVSNVHTIKAKAICKEGSTTEAEKVILTFADGTTKEKIGDFQQCGGFTAAGGDAEDSTAYADIQILSESGGAESVKPEQVNEKEAEIDIRAPTPGQSDVEKDPNAQPPTTTPPVTTGEGGGSSGCSLSAGPVAALPTLLLLLMLAVLVSGLGRARKEELE